MLSDSVEIQTFLRNNCKYYAALDDISKARDLELLSKVCSLSKETLQKVLANITPTIRQDQNQSSDSNFEKPNDFIPYKKNGSFRKRTVPLEANNIHCTWSDKYQLSDMLLSLTEMAKNNAESGGTLPLLIDNECSLVIVLTHSYDAFVQLQSSRTDFVFEPFAKLVNLIGDEYLRHPGNKEPFTALDYDALRKAIEEVKNKDEAENEKDSDDDPLGIFDDEMDDSSPYVEMDDKEKAFLLDFVSGIEKLSNDCFDMDTFKNNLVLHPYYVLWDRHEGKKNLSGISDSKDEIENCRPKGLLRKNSGKI